MKNMTILAVMMTMSISANAMSYNNAKDEALFLSDKMAYELNLTSAQYDAVYEINLDYMMRINSRGDVYGTWWNRRNTDLMYVLTAWQYNKYTQLSYFYRPLSWTNGGWTFNIYSHYSNRRHFYNSHPMTYASYKGGRNHNDYRAHAEKNADHRSSHNSGHTDGLLAHNSNSNNSNRAHQSMRGGRSARQ